MRNRELGKAGPRIGFPAELPIRQQGQEDFCRRAHDATPPDVSSDDPTGAIRDAHVQMRCVRGKRSRQRQDLEVAADGLERARARQSHLRDGKTSDARDDEPRMAGPGSDLGLQGGAKVIPG